MARKKTEKVIIDDVKIILKQVLNLVIMVQYLSTLLYTYVPYYKNENENLLFSL